jgi:ADP-ribosylglycohydrolase
MKFSGQFETTMKSAMKSKDKSYQKDVVLDEIARAIYTDRPSIVEALNNAGIKSSESDSLKTLIDKTAKGLYNNETFRESIPFVIAKDEYSNNTGAAMSALQSGGSSSGGGFNLGALGGILGGVSSVINGVFGSISTAQQKKLEEEKTKQLLYDKLLTTKKNPMPWIIMGGVLLIGGVAIFLTLRKK